MPPWRLISTRLSGPIALALSLAGAGNPSDTTSDGQWLDVVPSAPLEGVRFIGIETIESPSWVA